MRELTNSDKQMIQSSINHNVASLKRRIKALYSDYLRGLVPESKWHSGREAIKANIARLHSIKHKMGINSGYSQQPGSPYRDADVSVVISITEVTIEEELIVWEGEGGSFI